MNYQVAEQLHRSVVRDTYFLDSMCPTHHIFLMRNLIEVHNVALNKKAVLETQTKSKMFVSIDKAGRMFTTGGMDNHALYFELHNYYYFRKS